MLYSAYFAERAEHYRELAGRMPSGCQAGYQLGLANLFLEMSCDMRHRELAVEPTVRRGQNGTHIVSRHLQAFSNELLKKRSISAWST